MGIYLNQLPPTEVARLKAELAETLIANFCYPRFYDYRINALRTRPVDRSKRQEVWQYLNAVDFNVWGRVDVDSPDFQHQVERLFIHFVQHNRNFFGAQGRRRMADVRSLITNCSLVLAEGMRKHLQGKQGNPPLGSPRPVFSWGTAGGSKQAEPNWDQILSSTMQLQQQLQEVRGEVQARIASAPVIAVRPENSASGAPMRRSRSARLTAHDATNPDARSARLAAHDATSAERRDGETPTVSPMSGKPTKVGDGRLSVSFPASMREPLPPYLANPVTADAAPTLPLPLSRPENTSPTRSPSRGLTESPAPPKHPKMDTASAAPPARSPNRPLSRPLSTATGPHAVPKLPTVAAGSPGAEVAVKQPEQAPVVDDEDVVIFEQMRYQLIVELRVEAVRSGIELNGQSAPQLIEVLRHQEDMDLARLQVVSTLLNMCDQIITSGHATLFDYKQAMMFYLMHTRRSR